MNLFPVVYFIEKNWRILLAILCMALCFLMGWKTGSDRVQTQWDLAVAKQETKVLTKIVKQVEVTTQVVTQYVDRIKTVKEKGDAIITEVPIYVTSENDRHCDVPMSFGLLWNAANAGEIPSPPRDLDASTDPPGLQEIDRRPSTTLLSDISRQHAVEAATCHATEAQLTALQDWVRQQYNLDHPEEPLAAPEAPRPANEDPLAPSGIE